MSPTKYTPPSEKEEKRRCCSILKWDFALIPILLVIGLVFCPTCCDSAERMNEQTEKLKNEIETRP